MFDEEHKEHIAAGLRREDVQPTNCGVVCKEEIYRIYYVIYYIYICRSVRIWTAPTLDNVQKKSAKHKIGIMKGVCDLQCK